MNRTLCRVWWIRVILLGIVIVVGLSSIQSAAARPLDTASVAIVLSTFSPDSVTIHASDTVEWTKTDGVHNIAADDGSFRSGEPTTAQFVFSHAFGTPGTFAYHCEVHGAFGMRGTVIVLPAGGEVFVANLYLPYVTHP